MSPDAEALNKVAELLEHRPTVGKILEVVRVLNEEVRAKNTSSFATRFAHHCRFLVTVAFSSLTPLRSPQMYKIADYAVKNMWRAKDILNAEGVSDPKHVIPGEKMSRLVSLLISNDLSQFDPSLKIVQRVTSGEGLDVQAVKDLLRHNLDSYEDHAPEIDRVVRWAALMLNPIEPPANYVETNVKPLSEVETYSRLFRNILCARAIYVGAGRDKQVPLSMKFSAGVSRVAPYLSLKQIEFLLEERKETDWQVKDLRR